jgi:hypothetical protein
MVDPAFALTMREEGGKPVFERDGQGKVLKAKGRILTLTAREAVECTLAEGVVPDLKAVGQRLGMPEWQEVGARPGVQTANAGGPVKSASGACATPDSLYEMLYDKVVSLGLTGDLTQIQEKKALKDWTAWFDTQHLAGRRVQWNIALVQASEGEMRLVPDLSHYSEGARLFLMQKNGERWKFLVKPKAGAALKLSGSIKGLRWRVEDLEEEMDRQGSAYFLNLLRETQAYPIKVTAKTDTEPRVFHMVAWVSARSRDALTRVSPESEIVLSGKIGEIVPYLSEDGVFIIEIILDQCELVQEGAAGTSDRDKDADGNCKQWLSLARNYIRAGMPEKAIPYLKQVIEQYGDTEYAKQARELEQEALRMMPVESEGEDAPPTEAEPTPELTK